MLEPINCSKVLKVWWGEWLSVIGEYLIWNAVSGEAGFRLVDYLLGCLACQPVNFEVVWVLINGDKKISVVQLEQVHADFLPWSCRYVVTGHWLISLLWLVTVVGAALGYVVFYFLVHVHARPVQSFSSSSQTALNANVTWVKFLCHFFTQRCRNDKSFTLKNKPVLHSELISKRKVVPYFDRNIFFP